MGGFAPAETPALDKARHIKYWTRCLKTLLPRHYTGNESNRMYLAFCILSALDQLDIWQTAANETERAEYVNWIYRCQHPDGGFRMWPGTDFGELSVEANAKWDPANVPATYFALASLLAVGDDLKRVKREDTLAWVKRMQRRDGSFGETLVDGQIEGGRDPRFAYCAMGVRYILRGISKQTVAVDGVKVEDVDVDGLVTCIRNSESYDGGIADMPFSEPHAGYEFCSLGALYFLDRLSTSAHPKGTLVAPSEPSMTVRWLVERQTDLEDPEGEVELQPEMSIETDSIVIGQPKDPVNSNDSLHQSPDKSLPRPLFGVEPLEAGMNGRANKVADTCYAWWAGASFCLMGLPDLFSHQALQRYLLCKTQHPVLGGFGKFPGDLPDLYHSYLGLAALGLMKTEGVKEIDPAMCISKEASSRLPALWDEWKI